MGATFVTRRRNRNELEKCREKMVMFLDKMPDKAADLYLHAELPRAVENVHNVLCRLTAGARGCTQTIHVDIREYT